MKVQLVEDYNALPKRNGDYLLIYEPGVSIIYRGINDLPKYPVITGKYIMEGKVYPVSNFPDITERAELGPVRIYMWDYLESIEAEKYGEIWEYYARLRLYSSGRTHLTLEKPISQKPRSETSGKLHTEAFSYLQYSPEFEMKLEEIFLNFLKWVGGYLHKPLGANLYEKPYKPYISVIVPVKNREKFIGETLKSLLENDFDDWECVVVDNGSTDGTREIVKRFSRADSRIRLVEVKNKTLTQCLNIGLKNSKGWIVSQLDSEVLYTPDALRTIYEYHKEYRNIALAISYYQVVDEDGKPVKEIDIVKHLEFSINNILRVEGAGAVRTYKREALERIGGFDEKNIPGFGEDYDVVLRLCEIFLTGRIHKVLYKYRRHAGSTDALYPLLEKKRIKTGIRWSAITRRRIINSTLKTSTTVLSPL